MAEKTLGETRVRTDFNPSGCPVVAKLKGLAAKLIDEVHALEHSGDVEFHRMKAIAMMEVESAAHWAVKAATHLEGKKKAPK